jgi:TRAP-type C4-dicarboxylate transport system substrate-binding protein
MQMPLRRFGWILALVIPALLGISPAEARELKLAHFMPPGHTLQQGVFEPLAAELAQATAGGLTIRIYPSGALGKGPVQQYKRVVEGVADITFCIQSYTAGIFPRSLLVTEPGVAVSAVEGTRRMWAIFDPLLKDEYREVKVLGLWVMSPTALITRSRPVRALPDLAGMKVRISSPVESALILAWGAVPVAMPITESYNALNTGIVDAVLIQPSALYQPWNLADAACCVTANLPGPTSVVLLAMNRGSWEGLSAAEQAALDALTGPAFSLKAAAIWSAVDDKALAQASEAGGVEAIALTPEAHAELAAAARPVIEADLAKLEAEGINAREIYQALIR